MSSGPQNLPRNDRLDIVQTAFDRDPDDEPEPPDPEPEHPAAGTMMMQQPEINYAAVRQDLKIKAGIFFTYLALVRVVPLVVDAVASKK